MASSSVTTPPIATSRVIWGNNDLVNHSTNNWSGMTALTSLRRHLHSWIWSEICMEVVGRREVNSSVHVSYRMGSLKCVRKDMARQLKSWKDVRGNSIYHFIAEPVSFRWKRRKQIESSMRELDEHHKWKVMTWLFRSSSGFLSNFGISEGGLVGMAGQTREW